MIGFGLAAITLALLGYLITGPWAQTAAVFDARAARVAQSVATPWITSSLKIITEFGSTLVLTIVGTIAVAAFIVQRRSRAIGCFAIAMSGQITLHEGFKFLIARPRPPLAFDYTPAESYSFPSGHALASLCVYGILSWLFTRRVHSKRVSAIVWVLVVGLILSIGFSRVYFNVHYATDVIAGYLAASIWTVAVSSSDTGH